LLLESEVDIILNVKLHVRLKRNKENEISMDSRQLIIIASIIAIILGDYDYGKYNLLILENAINNI